MQHIFVVAYMLFLRNYCEVCPRESLSVGEITHHSPLPLAYNRIDLKQREHYRSHCTDCIVVLFISQFIGEAWWGAKQGFINVRKAR